ETGWSAVMSALPPIATLIAFFGMSALGQKRTCAASKRCPFLSTARTTQCYALAGRNGAITGGIHESRYSFACVHHFCGIAGRGRQGGGRTSAVGLSGE